MPCMSMCSQSYAMSHPAQGMSHYDALLAENQYSVGPPGTLSFIIYFLAARFMVMIPGGPVGAAQEDQG